MANIERQLELTGTDHFDAMFIHDPVEIEPTLAKGGTFECLKTLKSRGIVRNIGYAMNPHDFHLTTMETGEIDVLLTFDDYNLFGTTAADDILPAAAERDIGVINGWSIKRGLLTGIDLSGRDRSNPEVDRAIKNAPVVYRQRLQPVGDGSRLLPARGTHPRQPHRQPEHRAVGAERARGERTAARRGA